ncbi:hypothetical protein V6N12_050957 [Hibiscus sabdariffa]|uniref:Uncharacterized protein n=1 Tax=Hibiscus sabdariffa TaxID=183260 RepID=A0ABR2GEA7_9ROSI
MVEAELRWPFPYWVVFRELWWVIVCGGELEMVSRDGPDDGSCLMEMAALTIMEECPALSLIAEMGMRWEKLGDFDGGDELKMKKTETKQQLDALTNWLSSKKFHQTSHANQLLHKELSVDHCYGIDNISPFFLAYMRNRSLFHADLVKALSEIHFVRTTNGHSELWDLRAFA